MDPFKMSDNKMLVKKKKRLILHENIIEIFYK